MSAVVGIDVGAYKHAAAVCRAGKREAERGVFRLSADRAGFDELDRWLERQGPVERVVLESSGHYYWPLASHLQRRGYGLSVVNPLQAKYFAKSRLQRSKSDPADARTLAALGMSEEPRVKDPLLGAEAKEAARFWGGLVKEQAQIRNKLLRLVEIGFPELQECFEDPLCATALAVLREAPTARAAARKRVSTLAATFIAEIGDIWRFEDFDQLASYAGIHPKEMSSGTKGQNPETRWRMAKTGNAYLRSAAYKMAVIGTQHNPMIRAHYLRKRAQGKSAMNALGHCMSKALAIIWGVWRSGLEFDPTLGGPRT